jgi:predicted PurR-regulated permease PerM
VKPGRPDATPPKREYPSPFQHKTLWTAITGAALLGTGAMSVYTVSVVADVLQFLQPVLVPVAFAGILAYLLQPLVDRLVKRGTPRFRAMMWVWIMFHLLILLLFLSVAVPTVSKGGRLIAARSDQWVQNIGNFTGKILEAVDKLTDKVTHFKKAPATPSPATPPTVSPAPVTAPDLATVPPVEGTSSANPPGPLILPSTLPDETILADPASPINPQQSAARATLWLAEHSEAISSRVVAYISSGVQGFLGIFGYLVGFILVPVYLYYFLKESDSIKQNWSNYVPLRASKFKAEVVSVLGEINSYLIAFFRGQMLVSMIDGLLVGLALTIIGLPYAMLIGVFVAILGLIPYVGNFLCWLGAVLIAIAHFGRTDAAGQLVNTFAGMQDLWVYPVLVTVLFVVVQQINSLVTAPRIIGDATGLHPLTVIFSVLFWSLLIGGLLGALLAVPLTASVKVLFRRYIWERQVQHHYQPASRPGPVGD